MVNKQEKNQHLLKPIVLCGFMGSGKSGLGRVISERTGTTFFDLDEMIEHKYEKKITELFEIYGEAWFRETEKNELIEFLNCQHQNNQIFVLSLGGGTLQSKELVSLINTTCDLWFIEVPFDQLINRVMKRTTRPLLLDKEGKMKPKNILYQELKALYSKRLPIYKLATHIFESNDNLSKEDNAEQLLASIASKQLED